MKSSLVVPNAFVVKRAITIMKQLKRIGNEGKKTNTEIIIQRGMIIKCFSIKITLSYSDGIFHVRCSIQNRKKKLILVDIFQRHKLIFMSSNVLLGCIAILF